MSRRNNGLQASVWIAPLIALGIAGEAAPQTAPDEPGSGIQALAEPVVGGNGVRLAVYEAGTPGRPAIVFIHGFSQNSLTWERQFSGPLAEAFHLVAYDLRGHGASAEPPAPDAYLESSLWAEDLAAVIRDRGLQRPVLVGWSYGGYVITDYLRRYGDADIGGIVLVASVTKNGTEDAPGYLTDEVLAVFGDVLASDVRRSITGTRALVNLWAEPNSTDWLMAYGSAMMVPPEVRLAMFSRVLDNDDILARIGVPVLVVHGRDDRIVRVKASEHAVRMVPGARLVLYDGAGHTPHLDVAERFDRDLAAFVRSLTR